MAGMNFIGSYSGIDQGVIDQLMSVERQPLGRMNRQKNEYENLQDSWREANSKLNSLQNALEALGSEDTYLERSINVSREEVVTAAADSQVLVGDYELEVTNLASRSRMMGDVIPETAEAGSHERLNFEGSFSLQSADGEQVVIQVEENFSLQTIMRSINRQSDRSGVEAAIIDNRLVLQSADYGDKDINLQAQDASDILEKLGFEDDQGNMVSVERGRSAQFSINGIEMERNENVISDAVDGLTFRLHQSTGEGETARIRVEEDLDAVVKTFEKFVSQYNQTFNFLRSSTDAGEPGVPEDQGKLYGENSLVRLQNSLRLRMTSSLEGSTSSIEDLSSLGITTVDREGSIELDANQLKEALKESPRDVYRFFNEEVEGEKVGFYNRMNSLLESFTERDSGIIANRKDSLERRMQDVDRRIEAFERRMEKREEYYMRMFTRLDTAMMEAESRSNWLRSQLGALNAGME